MSAPPTTTLLGKWNGTYDYPKDTGYPVLKPVAFEIEVVQVDGKRFRGNVTDGEGGTPGTGTVRGKLAGRMIAFTKQMPIRSECNEDGTTVIDGTKPHYPLLYAGQVSPDQRYIEGTWRFKKIWVFLFGILPYRTGMGSGTFVMRKADG